MPHVEETTPLSLSSDKTKTCAQLGCREIAKVQRWEISIHPMTFPSQTHISSFKLHLMPSVRDREKPLHPTLPPTTPKEWCLEQRGYLLLSFCFKTGAYCAPLLLPPTGANLFRSNSSVVSFMLLEKKREGIFCVCLLNKISWQDIVGRSGKMSITNLMWVFSRACFPTAHKD